MKIALKRSHVAAGVIVASIIGYPVVSVFSNVFDVDNQAAAITIRALVVALAAVLFLGRMEVKSRLAVGLFVVFWTTYILRLAYTFGLTNETTSVPASTFLLWSMGVCLIPSMAILLYVGRINFVYTGLMFSFIGSVTLIGILLLGGTVIETSLGVITDQNRWNLSTINPITIGHTGTSLVLVASAGLLYGNSSGRMILFYTAVALIGLVGLFLANSRGPLVAMVMALGMYGLAQIRSRRTWRYTILGFLAGMVLVYRYSEAFFASRGLLGRFINLLTDGDASSLVRTNLLADAFAQFANSPFVGDGVEVRTQAYYPHNVVLEAFMTTGIVGGTAFLLLILLSLRASFRILKFEPCKAVLALLAVQYIVAAQLSGAIYQSGAMWVLMAGVLGFSNISMGVRSKPARRGILPATSTIHRPAPLGGSVR